MDPRHEIIIQELSNDLILFINKYIQENLDDVLVDSELCSDINIITNSIYANTDIFVDVEKILSKKNLLSLDTVFFPLLHEAGFNKQNLADFSRFFKQIELIADKDSDGDNSEFYEQVLKILARYSG